MRTNANREQRRKQLAIFRSEQNRKVKSWVNEEIKRAEWCRDPIPVMSELIREYAAVEVNRFYNLAESSGLQMSHAETLDHVQTKVEGWNRQRKLLESSLATNGALFSLWGSARIVEIWQDRRKMQGCLVVHMVRDALTSDILCYLDQLPYSRTLKCYYCKPEKIVDFIRGLREKLRQSKREYVDFRLEAIPYDDQPCVPTSEPTSDAASPYMTQDQIDAMLASYVNDIRADMRFVMGDKTAFPWAKATTL